MKRIVSGGLLVLTCGILLGVFSALASTRFDLCDQAPTPQLPLRVASLANVPAPTPAPPREIVTVQIQTDHPDLEVGWAEN
jgi:hypothetical protein